MTRDEIVKSHPVNYGETTFDPGPTLGGEVRGQSKYDYRDAERRAHKSFHIILNYKLELVGRN